VANPTVKPSCIVRPIVDYEMILKKAVEEIKKRNRGIVLVSTTWSHSSDILAVSLRLFEKEKA
jgi:hypothetical protein